MTNKGKLITSFCLLCTVAAAFACWQYMIWRWRQNVVDLNGTVQTGIQIQLVVNDFKMQIGRYPNDEELTQLLRYISSFNEGVSPYQTNTITAHFDNSGGWFYNATNGEVRINYHGRKTVGFRSWVDLAKIDFHIPPNIEVVRSGRHETLDYSSLDHWLYLE